MTEPRIAALYIERGGPYWGLRIVDAWDIRRDARRYDGPHPVVAHPPCGPWGRYSAERPTTRQQQLRGDDGGTFAAALAAVRRFGGVLEHPASSRAWAAHRLLAPHPDGGWSRADHLDGYDGWTCQVDQGRYGHTAPKPTWLYARLPGGVGILPPSLDWRPSDATGRVENLSRRQRAATPLPFRDALLAIADTWNQVREPTA